MTTRKLSELVYYEQHVNDRFGTSSADSVPEFMRPETGSCVPLCWQRVPAGEAEVVAEQSVDDGKITRHAGHDGFLLYPLHPLEADKVRASEIVESGHIRFSASYRTVFYYPEDGGPFSSYCDPGQCLMIKLNLTEKLPGIPGDRRLDRDTIRRCVQVGPVIVRELSAIAPDTPLRIVTEPFGIVVGDTGALFRPITKQGIVPLFSLFSRDARNEEGHTLLEAELRERYAEDPMESAKRFGDDVAGPLVRALLDGYRCGFSLEMHAQNTLISIGDDRLIDRVHFRDLEGALVSNSLRERLGLRPIRLEGKNVFGDEDAFPVGRIFNRNLDHDLGRVFRGCLNALHKSRYFGSRERRAAQSSIRRAVRTALCEAELPIAHVGPRILPISRAPWGSGLRPGHWFRAEFR
jgi:hypothetical protein